MGDICKEKHPRAIKGKKQSEAELPSPLLTPLYEQLLQQILGTPGRRKQKEREKNASIVHKD